MEKGRKWGKARGAVKVARGRPYKQQHRGEFVTLSPFFGAVCGCEARLENELRQQV